MGSGKCPNCGNTSKSSPCTVCDGCKSEVHLGCVGLNADDIRITRNKSKSIKILCVNCNMCMGELGDFKKMLSDMNDKFTRFEEKIFNSTQSEFKELKSAIAGMQDEIGKLRSASGSSVTNASIMEDVVQEISEREMRKSNLIVFGLVEHDHTSSQERISADRAEVAGMCGVVIPSMNVDNIKVFRLGRRTEGRNRPLRVVMNSVDEVRGILRKARDIRATDRFRGVSLSYDRTPMQVEYYRELKTLLNERLKKGETNLVIKYVNGSPKIMNLNH